MPPGFTCPRCGQPGASLAKGCPACDAPIEIAEDPEAADVPEGFPDAPRPSIAFRLRRLRGECEHAKRMGDPYVYVDTDVLAALLAPIPEDRELRDRAALAALAGGKSAVEAEAEARRWLAERAKREG